MTCSKIGCFLLCLEVLVATGCGQKKEASQTNEASESSEANESNESDQTKDNALIVAGDIFAQDVIHEVQITLPPSQWEHLLATAQDEQYTVADVTIDGEHIDTTGLRFKGDWGSLYNCFNEANELICPRLSMKLKFSEYLKEQRFQGMKRLNLHGMQQDETMLAEYLGYDLYRSMGIMTARTAYAEVFINGENQGIYGLVEQIDGRFTQNRFGDNGDGYLYKESWPNMSTSEYWNQGIKTHEETATHADIIALSNALQNATDETLPQVLSTWIDVDYMLKYIAVNEAINNWDGITMWYPQFDGSSGYFNHNFYWYQEESRPYFWLFPWDLDYTFMSHSWNGNPPRWNDLTVNCDEPVYMPESGHLVMPPSCDPLIRGLALLGKEPFAAAADELLTNYFNQSVLNKKIDAAVALLTEAVKRDPKRTMASWMAEVNQLKGRIPILVDRLIQMKDGVPLAACYLEKDSINDFETATTTGIHMSTFQMGNTETSAQIYINETAPLNGTKDFRMDIEFFDDGETTWYQWALENLPISGQNDFSQLQGIRLKVLSDATRDFSISLRSRLSSSEGSWQWSTTASATPQTLELSVDDLGYPSWWTGAQIDLDVLLKNLSSIQLLVFPNSVGINGLLAAPENAFIQFDDIEFVFAPTDTDTETK